MLPIIRGINSIYILKCTFLNQNNNLTSEQNVADHNVKIKDISRPTEFC